MLSNGSIATIDENGEPTHHKANIFVTHLKAMKESGLITDEVIVHANHTTQPVSFWLESEVQDVKDNNTH